MRRKGSVSISVRTLTVGAVITVLTVAVVVLGWLYFDARQQVSAPERPRRRRGAAEKIALDYAVNAATMDFKDLQAMARQACRGHQPGAQQEAVGRGYIDGTGSGSRCNGIPPRSHSSPRSGPTPAESTWSTAFVSVQTKTVQAPEALQSTATYSTTIDSNNGLADHRCGRNRLGDRPEVSDPLSSCVSGCGRRSPPWRARQRTPIRTTSSRYPMCPRTVRSSGPSRSSFHRSPGGRRSNPFPYDQTKNAVTPAVRQGDGRDVPVVHDAVRPRCGRRSTGCSTTGSARTQGLRYTRDGNQQQVDIVTGNIGHKPSTTSPPAPCR